MARPKSIAVIIATYNWPRALELVLWGYASQTDRDFHVVVADDGSGPETAETISRMREATGLDIRHVWHADDGFRKCEILNKAISATDAEYVIFTDGDTIPREDFVAIHRAVARPGAYAAGMCVRLPEDISAQITAEDVRSGRATDRAWLESNGVRLGRYKLRFSRSYWVNRFFDSITTSRRRFRGLNSAAWREDLLRVNGFNNRMQYGGLDAEIGDRLDNAGLEHIRVRFRAMTVHLWHKRPWREQATVESNVALRKEIQRARLVRTPDGIEELAS